MCKPNPDPGVSPVDFRVPLDWGMLESAREMYQDNQGALATHLLSTGLLIGDTVELPINLVSLLVQMDEIPISCLDHAFGANGRQAWAIARSEPIFLFWCLDCREELCSRNPNHLRSLKRELEALLKCSVGDLVSTNLLCGRCTELRLHAHKEACRVNELARRARIAQLSMMPLAEYRLTREWQVKRTQALTRAGYRCQACGERNKRLDVHHNTYGRYGKESIYDLVVLCECCHALFHGLAQEAS